MTTPLSWLEAARHYLHREQRRPCPTCPDPLTDIVRPLPAMCPTCNDNHPFRPCPQPSITEIPSCGTCWNAKDLNGDPECRECGRRFITPPPAWTQQTGESDLEWHLRLRQLGQLPRPHGDDCIHWCSGVDCDQLHACWCTDSAYRDAAYDSIANQQELRP